MEKEHKIQSQKSKVFLYIIAGFFTIGIWIYIGNNFMPQEKKDRNEFMFTNPALQTDLWENIMRWENINLEHIFTTYEQEKIAKWDILNLSVYFRDLNNGNWFGTEEKEMFSPASLMKLPLLLAYYKQSEYDPSLLQKKLKFTINWTMDDYTQNIKPENRLVPWKEYTIEEIMRQMIIHSDNEASIFLERNIHIDEFKKVFMDIWLFFPPIISWNFDNNIRVVDYAAFFRILFNASYLNKENSQKVLWMLTQTTFKDGLIKGVNDTNIKVSHKFGERSIFGNNWIERMQLHDCGIVYYPNHPYILCIMTRWYEFETLKKVIEDVSNITYKKINETYN
jgi:beta-lactamase class A